MSILVRMPVVTIGKLNSKILHITISVLPDHKD